MRMICPALKMEHCAGCNHSEFHKPDEKCGIECEGHTCVMVLGIKTILDYTTLTQNYDF